MPGYPYRSGSVPFSIDTGREVAIREGLNLRVSLEAGPSGLVGYRARRYAGVVDVDEIAA